MHVTTSACCRECATTSGVLSDTQRSVQSQWPPESSQRPSVEIA